MRLFLDAHVSGRRIAEALRRGGHDVRAADEQRALDGTSDEELLELAATEGRIFVTFDVKDFARITRRWSEAGRHHAGCAMIVGIDHSEFGTIIEFIQRTLDAKPTQVEWAEYTCFVSRRG